jgi:hypothetical protein
MKYSTTQAKLKQLDADESYLSFPFLESVNAILDSFFAGNLSRNDAHTAIETTLNDETRRIR